LIVIPELALLFHIKIYVNFTLHTFPTRRSSDLIASKTLQFGLGYSTNHRRSDVKNGIPCQATYQLKKHLFGRWRSIKLCGQWQTDRKSTRLNSSHVKISYAVFCLNKKTIR